MNAAERNQAEKESKRRRKAGIVCQRCKGSGEIRVLHTSTPCNCVDGKIAEDIGDYDNDMGPSQW